MILPYDAAVSPRGRPPSYQCPEAARHALCTRTYRRLNRYRLMHVESALFVRNDASATMLLLLALRLAPTVCGSAGVILEHNSAPTVVYDQLGNLSVDRDASYNDDVKTEAEFLRRLGFEVQTLRYTTTLISTALHPGGQASNNGTTEYINCTVSRFAVTYEGTTPAVVRTALNHALAVWAGVPMRGTVAFPRTM